MTNLLSERGTVARDWEDFLYKNLEICNNNPFNEKNNRTGYIHFGTSVNRLCDDILIPKLKHIWKCDFDSLIYKEGRGTLTLRTAIANIMTEFLESYEKVSPDDLFCVTGVTSAIDILGHFLADSGEVFLVPSPMYGRILTDFIQRSLVETFPIHIITEDENDSKLTMEKVIYAYEKARSANLVVRGIFLINPSNPLGEVYSQHLLMEIMNFCKTNCLQIIVDEVYALSVFSETEKFHSILKFPTVPDPDRTHVLYGLSKDFAVGGLRIGVIHTKCKQLQECLHKFLFYPTIPPPIMKITANLLNDLDWCRKFVKANKKRLGDNYTYCANYLKKLGIKIRESSAGFYLWVDLREFCESSFEGERKLFSFMLDKFRLNIGPGEKFHCAQPGWFRIVITQPTPKLEEGLRRFKEGIKEYKSTNHHNFH